MRSPLFPYLAKDFIETAEGFIFAVVSTKPQQDGKIGCFLRYALFGSQWRKVATEQANQILQHQAPIYLYHSEQFDADYHAVLPDQILSHHQPEKRLKMYLEDDTVSDELVIKLRQLIATLTYYGADSETMGITGSMLIGQQASQSDIDLVIYGHDAFHRVRSALKSAIESNALQPLNETLMQQHYARRSSSLSFDEFSSHEYRKYNKAVIDGTKFDISMVNLAPMNPEVKQYQKQGKTIVNTEIVDDRFGFDYPARYQLSDDIYAEVIVYTQTYVGQAFLGEKVEISGAIETDIETGLSRLIVGSTREAIGEYIRVIC